jgi:hypothetical protein
MNSNDVEYFQKRLVALTQTKEIYEKKAVECMNKVVKDEFNKDSLNRRLHLLTTMIEECECEIEQILEQLDELRGSK